MSIGIIDSSLYLPQVYNSNEEVCSYVEGLSPDWIISKTGIKMRYHVDVHDTASYMAGVVANSLVARNDLESGDVGLIIVASFSQDYMFPPMSAKVHSIIRASKNCQIIDLNVNCVDLVTGTTIAVERMNADKSIKYAIVIGVEILSKFINKKDKFTAPFFSDGASAVLLGRVDKGYGFLKAKFCTDSSVYESVKLRRGGFIEQDGKATWHQAITNVPYVLKELVHSSRMAMKDIDFIIFHQANKVLIDYIMDKSRIPHEKTFTNVEAIGNTGAASIGIAFAEASRRGLIKKDMLVIFVGVGAGFNFGANLWKMQKV